MVFFFFFYKQCSRAVGFYSRHNTTWKSRDDVVLLKHIVCSREGFKNACLVIQYLPAGVNVQTTPMKSWVANRIGCKARVVFKLMSISFYVVHLFDERHNHCMCSIISR